MLASISWCFLADLSSDSAAGEGPRNAGGPGAVVSSKEGPGNPKELRVGGGQRGGLREPRTGGGFIGGHRGGPKDCPRGFSAGEEDLEVVSLH